MTGSWKGRGNQYIQFVRVLYCKLPTNSKQLPAFPLEAVPGIEPRPQRWEARVLPLCHRGPLLGIARNIQFQAGTYDIDLQVRHILGKTIVLADLLSRWDLLYHPLQKLKNLFLPINYAPITKTKNFISPH